MKTTLPTCISHLLAVMLCNSTVQVPGLEEAHQDYPWLGLLCKALTWTCCLPVFLLVPASSHFPQFSHGPKNVVLLLAAAGKLTLPPTPSPIPGPAGGHILGGPQASYTL